jgi:hypothetical protein
VIPLPKLSVLFDPRRIVCSRRGVALQTWSERELITGIYKSFNARNIDAVLARMHRDVDWPNGMEGGRERGHENVRAYWQRQWTAIDPRVDPTNIRNDVSGRTVVDVHQVIRDLSGKVLMDRMVQHVYSIKDGLITRMDIVEPEDVIAGSAD